MLERVQHGAAGREEAKWQKFPPEQRAHEAQHCVHHKSRSVVLIPSNLISPRGSALICQEFFWCRKPPPVHGGREGKKKPPYCFCVVKQGDIFHHLTCRSAGDLFAWSLSAFVCNSRDFLCYYKAKLITVNVVPPLSRFRFPPLVARNIKAANMSFQLVRKQSQLMWN